MNFLHYTRLLQQVSFQIAFFLPQLSPRVAIVAIPTNYLSRARYISINKNVAKLSLNIFNHSYFLLMLVCIIIIIIILVIIYKYIPALYRPISPIFCTNV